MPPHKRLLLAAVTTCTALVLPAVASAEDYCVGAPAGCAGTPVAAGGLKAALAAAQSNGTGDRFILARRSSAGRPSTVAEWTSGRAALTPSWSPTPGP